MIALLDNDGIDEHFLAEHEVASVGYVLEIGHDELEDGLLTHMFQHPEGPCLVSRVGGRLPRHVRKLVGIHLTVGLALTAETNVAGREIG